MQRCAVLEKGDIDGEFRETRVQGKTSQRWWRRWRLESAATEGGEKVRRCCFWAARSTAALPCGDTRGRLPGLPVMDDDHMIHIISDGHYWRCIAEARVFSTAAAIRIQDNMCVVYTIEATGNP